MVEEREIPNLSGEKELCCGCAACYSVCPVEAITMEADEKGFLYPKILESVCIRCQRCIQVCAFKKEK